MATSGRTVTLQSSDLMQFVVDREIAKNSGVVRNLLEDFSDDNPTIPFMNVRGKILEKVIEFMTYHHNHSFLLGDDKEKDSTAIEPWDKNFCNVDQATLFELLQAANFMDVKGLLDVTCKTVANMIRGKTPEEIRKTFGIVNDFTPEEEEQIRKENLWCEELK